jgi:hypothetical protein
LVISNILRNFSNLLRTGIMSKLPDIGELRMSIAVKWLELEVGRAEAALAVADAAMQVYNVASKAGGLPEASRATLETSLEHYRLAIAMQGKPINAQPANAAAPAAVPAKPTSQSLAAVTTAKKLGNRGRAKAAGKAPPSKSAAAKPARSNGKKAAATELNPADAPTKVKTMLGLAAVLKELAELEGLPTGGGGGTEFGIDHAAAAAEATLTPAGDAHVKEFIELMTAVIKLAPKNYDAYIGLGDVLKARGDPMAVVGVYSSYPFGPESEVPSFEDGAP